MAFGKECGRQCRCCCTNCSVAAAARSTHNPQQHFAVREPTAANCLQPCQERNTCRVLGLSIPCPPIPHWFTPAQRCPAAWRACRRDPGPPRHTSGGVDSVDEGKAGVRGKQKVWQLHKTDATFSLAPPPPASPHLLRLHHDHACVAAHRMHQPLNLRPIKLDVALHALHHRGVQVVGINAGNARHLVSATEK